MAQRLEIAVAKRESRERRARHEGCKTGSVLQSDSTPTHDLPTVTAIEWEVDQEAPTHLRWERPERGPSELDATLELWATPDALYAQMRAADPDATPVRLRAAEPKRDSFPPRLEDSFPELTAARPLAETWCVHAIPQAPVPISFTASPLPTTATVASTPAPPPAPLSLKPLLLSFAALGAALGALIAVLYRIVQALPAP